MQKYLHILFVTLIGIYIFGIEYLPFQDYPNWLYQGYVFNQYVFHGNSFNGFFHFFPYIPPNAISTIGIGLLMLVFPSFFAGKIFLFATAVLLYTGITLYLSDHLPEQKNLAAILGFYFVFNLNFLLGLVNCSFGFGLGLLIIRYVVRRKFSVSPIILSLLIVLLYLSHFIDLAIVILYIGFYAFSSKRITKLIRLLPAFIPASIIFIEYQISKGISDFGIHGHSQPLLSQIYLFVHEVFSIVIPFHCYKWVSETPILLKATNYGFCIIVIAAMLYSFSFFKKKSFEITFAVLLVLIMILLPDYFGGVILPATRFVVFFFMNIAVIFFRNVKNKKINISMCYVIASVSILSFGYNIVSTYHFNAVVSSGIMPSEAIIHSRYIFEGTDGFEHFYFYHGISNQEALPAFKSGLLDYEDGQFERAGWKAQR